MDIEHKVCRCKYGTLVYIDRGCTSVMIPPTLFQVSQVQTVPEKTAEVINKKEGAPSKQSEFTVCTALIYILYTVMPLICSPIWNYSLTLCDLKQTLNLLSCRDNLI